VLYYSVIKEFADNKINLTRIESRPTRQKAWEYNFYLDFEGHHQDKIVRETLDRVEQHTFFLKNPRLLSPITLDWKQGKMARLSEISRIGELVPIPFRERPESSVSSLAQRGRELERGAFVIVGLDPKNPYNFRQPHIERGCKPGKLLIK